MWTLEEARKAVAPLEAASVTLGWHFALAGGVFHRGKSDHDLDIIAYPRTSTDFDRDLLYWGLKCAGWRLVMDTPELHKHWKSKRSKDRKHVEVYRDREGRRIDLIILDGQQKKSWWPFG